jgi:hypothetical protein
VDGGRLLLRRPPTPPPHLPLPKHQSCCLFLKIRECGRTASARLERRALIRRYQLEPEHVVRVFEWRCASMSVGLRLLVPVSQCGCEPQIRRQLPRQIELHEASDPCVKPCSEPRPCRARRRISLSVGRKDGKGAAGPSNGRRPRREAWTTWLRDHLRGESPTGLSRQCRSHCVQVCMEIY